MAAWYCQVNHRQVMTRVCRCHHRVRDYGINPVPAASMARRDYFDTGRVLPLRVTLAEPMASGAAGTALGSELVKPCAGAFQRVTGALTTLSVAAIAVTAVRLPRRWLPLPLRSSVLDQVVMQPVDGAGGFSADAGVQLLIGSSATAAAGLSLGVGR